MSWTTPRDWTVGEVVTKVIMDAHIRDNLRYLKGIDGAITLSDSLILPDGAGMYLHIPILTTVQRNALTPTEGMLIYNSTTDKFNKYEDSAWRADLGYNSDHGTLAGLGDDDHSAYQVKTLLSAQGDIIYASSANTWAKLAKGNEGQYLKQGATIPEWAADTLVSGGIIMWHGSIATIPATYVICDGNNSTPNLLARFIQGVATAGTNPGATGGATSKTTSGHLHTGPSHQHETPFSLVIGDRITWEAGAYGTGESIASVSYNAQTGADSTSRARDLVKAAGTGNTGSQTDSIADIRPLFYDIAFIMKT